MKDKTPPRQTLAANLRYLMDLEHLSETKLAKRSGVAQRTINDILNQKSSATLDTVQALAAAFGLNLWHLIMPNLPDDLKKSPSISRLYASYVRASPEGRKFIEMAAEREASYSPDPPDKPASSG